MPRIKKIEEHSEDEGIEFGWDKNRIAIGIVILFFAIGIVLYYLPEQVDKIKGSVLGVFTQKVSAPPSKVQIEKDINTLIGEAQKQIKNITPENISSSSSELQKILKDIQDLQKNQKEPKEVICEYVCKDK